MAPKRSAVTGEQIQCPTTLKLTVEKGPLSGQTFEFGPRSRIQIGCVVRGNTLSIKDGGISSKHLLIEVGSGYSNKWAITDRDSSTGTFLNGSLLEPSESTGLSGGDVIKIGETTSMRVTFEAGGGGGVRRSTRRGGGELGVIDEDLELGFERGRIGNNVGEGVKNVIHRVLGTSELGLEVENGLKGGLGNDDGVKLKVIGRRTRRAAKAKDSKTEGVVVENKLISAKNLKKKRGVLDVEPPDAADKEKSENVGGVEGKRGRNVLSTRTTRSSTKSKLEGEALGRRGVQEEQRVNVSVRRTRSSRKEETFIDLSVVEGKRETRGAKEKPNLPKETPLEEEKNEELNILDLCVVDNRSWEMSYCNSVRVSWLKVLASKNYVFCHPKVYNWDDSGAKEAFESAKQRFWAKTSGLPFESSLPDPNMFIDEIDWNPHMDPELMDDLDRHKLEAGAKNDKNQCTVENSCEKSLVQGDRKRKFFTEPIKV